MTRPATGRYPFAVLTRIKTAKNCRKKQTITNIKSEGIKFMSGRPKWYILRNQKPTGPFTNDELRGKAATGEISPTDLIKKEGMTEWIKASRAKGLFSGSVESFQSQVAGFDTGELNQPVFIPYPEFEQLKTEVGKLKEIVFEIQKSNNANRKTFSTSDESLLEKNKKSYSATSSIISVVKLSVALVSMVVLGVILVVTVLAVSESSNQTTKEEWKKTFAQLESWVEGFGKAVEVGQMEKALGKPVRTQTIGDTGYWYYKCKDGDIQISFQMNWSEELIFKRSGMRDLNNDNDMNDSFIFNPQINDY